MNGFNRAGWTTPFSRIRGTVYGMSLTFDVILSVLNLCMTVINLLLTAAVLGIAVDLTKKVASVGTSVVQSLLDLDLTCFSEGFVIFALIASATSILGLLAMCATLISY